MGSLHEGKDGTESNKQLIFISLSFLCHFSLPVQYCMFLLQKRQVWCVMLNVLKMDAGVQVLTSVSPVHTSGLVIAVCQTVTLCQGM
jgi:hypothetical protein